MDSYYAQMNRMREYGSRRMERLWESYQAQINRVRAFSLQQRLRLMRQYQLKHKYVEKLLKTLNKSAVVKADSPPPLDPGWIELPIILPEDLDDCLPPSDRAMIGDEDYDDNDDDFHSIPEYMGDLGSADWDSHFGLGREMNDIELKGDSEPAEMIFDEQPGPSTRYPNQKIIFDISETNL